MTPLPRILIPLLGLLLCSHSLSARDYNASILAAVGQMPVGGGYSVREAAFRGLGESMRMHDSALVLTPAVAQPSFCSSATYHPFLQIMAALDVQPDVHEALLFRDQKDGEGIWGRWNANGPGVAKLFADLKLGKNFEDIEDAKPGDFMKIFWTPHIGKKEFGHLVIYLGHTSETLTFWSSNKPAGYGEKTIPRDKVNWAIFSRLTDPKRIRHSHKLPYADPFLTAMLSQEFTRDQVRKTCKIK